MLITRRRGDISAMKRKKTNEVKTGVMIVMCLLILLGLTAKVGGLSAFKKGYNLKVRFNYASGIKQGAPVYLTGVEVGEVKDLQIGYTKEGTKVYLTLWLDESAKVRQDSKAYIATMGLMGEKYLELTSGKKGTPFLQADSMIVGKEPIAMEEMTEKAMRISDNLNEGISDLRKLTKSVDLTVAANKTKINEIIDNMNATSKNFAEFSGDLKKNPWKLLIKTKEKKTEPKGD